MFFRGTLLMTIVMLVSGVIAHATTLVIDNFTCSNSVSLTGASGFNDNFVTCPDSLGGEREDFILISGGSNSSVTTMSSNPPANVITGTFGSGITAFEGMVWGDIPTDDLNLNLVGDSILAQIQSDSGGALYAALCSSFTTGDELCNGDTYSTLFAGNSSYQTVLIPLTGTPTVLGSGGNLANVNIIDLYVSLNTPGASWSIDGVDAVGTPEPTALLPSVLLLVIMATGIYRRRANTRCSLSR